MRNSGKVAATLFLAIVAAAVFAPFLGTTDPTAFDLSRKFEAPNAHAFFGLDQNGGDVYSQVLYGARTSLSISFTVVALSVAIGLIVASVATYKGGFADIVLARILDMVQAFPGFLLALALVAVLGPNARNLVIAMTATGWAGYARLIRGEVLHLKEREYVRGAQASGATPTRILVKHIWPNLASLLAVQATFGLAGVILAESGLSFLGLGVSADTPTWGALMNQGRRFLVEGPHISFFPGLALSILVLSIQLSGESLREWLNPRERRVEIKR
jgi:peptide/nickel transport system permease protein